MRKSVAGTCVWVAVMNQVRHGILAEELGYAGWAMTEHHFSVEGAEYSPNPHMPSSFTSSRSAGLAGSST